MAVRLRLRRVGKKKMPVYHIVAADSRMARSGKVLEVVGRYDPSENPPAVVAKEPRVFYWLKNGALPTETVRSLFQRSGLWLKWSMTKRGKDEAFIAGEMEKWQMVQAEKRQREIDRKVRRVAHRKAAKTKGTEGAPAPAAAPAAPAPQA